MPKHKPLKREVRHLYLLLLKENGQILSLQNIIKFYDDYDQFRRKAFGSKEAPNIIRQYLVKIEMPKYLKWIRQFLVEK